ncbi:glycoside hydrolase TIM-barrel-like domain-containing protein [Pseudahrensia aquimaris]|uniref:Glycoside hydrolase TIM-barrel-like domain-containing protein n=1 Tax=Pseudahrensia aquimaris TaxID=744461 RepID=A0ABW3FEI1_9HYPH
MATIILQTVGATVGTTLGGPIGGAIGSALGAAAGSAIDQSLFGAGAQNVDGPRLDSVRYLSSGEGNAIARLYGTSRIAGEIIWTTRFEEVISKKKVGGGKGGPPKSTVTEYSYYANFAVALCEGEIGGIGQVWADGTRINQSNLTLRVYRGTEDQMPDALIETKQGAGSAPAYRGTAYVVFENFALEEYGNRIPQISIEVIKPIGDLERTIKAVNLIPGASEFAYDTQPVIEESGKLSSIALNVHQSEAESDFLASLDMLQATCPNLEQVSLVVAWFGNDLRAGQCTIRPKVEVGSRKLAVGEDWDCAGLTRQEAELVSRIDGRPALGGTPSDRSVLRAIKEIKSRGLRVAITPFLMMDIPANNGLSDPYGENEQGAYPWRGRITGSLGPDTAQTSNRNEIASFVGGVTQTAGWNYRRMILHYAKLAQTAGGVDQFLIGSEMPGLTSLRDTDDTFPFVEALIQLADDARTLLGPNCLISYAADWTEYFHYRPNDGSGDLFYNLDPLWASANIDAVAIDVYFPLSDHRQGGEPSSQGRASNDPNALLSNIEAGEGYDWFYASEGDREAGVRSLITDGAAQKPWVYRFKDIRNWASNQHFDRRGGIEISTPSPWQPLSKPIIFAELGAPAVHNAATRPNVFADSKSSENGLPYFTNGGRDDLAQAAYLDAFLKYWDGEHSKYNDGTNPSLPSGLGALIDMSRCQIWAWDARPYPAFPQQTDVWSDGENWQRGHWLNGRLGRLRIADLIEILLLEAGFSAVDTSQVYGMVDGFILAEQASARRSLEALIDLFQITVLEQDGTLVFRSPGTDPITTLSMDEVVFTDDKPTTIRNRMQADDVAASVSLIHMDRGRDYQSAETSVDTAFGGLKNRQSINLPIATEGSELVPELESWLAAKVTARDTIQFNLSRKHTKLAVGDLVRFEDLQTERIWQLTEINEGASLECSAVSVRPQQTLPQTSALLTTVTPNPALGRLAVVFLDLPNLPFSDISQANRIAISALPWRNAANVYIARDSGVFEFQQSVPAPATVGELRQVLPASSVSSRWLREASIEVQLFNGELSSSTELGVLNGANAIAVGNNETGWEIIQFLHAVSKGNGIWELSGLLRGQSGTEDIAGLGYAQGTQIVVLDAAVEPLVGSDKYLGRALAWSIGPAGVPLDSPNSVEAIFEPGTRHLLPLGPVRLRAKQEVNGALNIKWVRRDRASGDDWQFVEIPMSEASEIYLVTLQAGPLVHEWSAIKPELTIAESELFALFGSGASIISISVSQVSERVGAGIATRISSSIQL